MSATPKHPTPQTGLALIRCTSWLGDGLPTPPDGFLEQYCQDLVRHWLMVSSSTTSTEARASLKHCAKQLITRIEMAQENRAQPNTKLSDERPH